MRNPQRIDSILERLKTIWKDNSDLRLGQLLLTVVSEDILFYVEDETIVQALESYYKHQ